MTQPQGRGVLVPAFAATTGVLEPHGTVLATLQGLTKPEPLMNKPIRLILLLSSLFLPFTAHAEHCPSRVIRGPIPFGAGSAADVVPRLVFDRLAAELGQSIVIENRVGAGGTLGTAVVAKADPDGYGIIAHSSALPITPALFPSLTVDATTARA